MISNIHRSIDKLSDVTCDMRRVITSLKELGRNRVELNPGQRPE
ncbi:MAG: hypothetical protein ACU84H_05200 [Gammaproteobacteria bacterium]